MVQYLVNNNQKEKAQSIADALALEYKSLKLPYSKFENKFDIIMTSKQIAEPQAAGYGGAMGAQFAYR